MSIPCGLGTRMSVQPELRTLRLAAYLLQTFAYLMYTHTHGTQRRNDDGNVMVINVNCE